MRIKHEEKMEARRLRSMGLSMKDISRQVGVSLSSVSLWVRDVVLTEEQSEHLHRQMGAIVRERGQSETQVVSLQSARKRKSEKCRNIRLGYQEQGRADARSREMGDLHIKGCMLFWAEGTKNKNVVKMSNSDPHLLRLFVTFMHECFDVPFDQMAIHCHCYTNNGLTIDEIERYWLTTLGLPECCLRKSIVDYRPANSMGLKVGKIPYGTVHIKAGRTAEVQRIFGAIKEYAGFDNSMGVD